MDTRVRQENPGWLGLSESTPATVQESMASLLRSPRFEVSWSRTAVKWVAITDRRTGIKVIGRDNGSWDAAMANAMAEMGRRFTGSEPSAA
jgi:hypothetical protein